MAPSNRIVRRRLVDHLIIASMKGDVEQATRCTRFDMSRNFLDGTWIPAPAEMTHRAFCVKMATYGNEDDAPTTKESSVPNIPKFQFAF
jgi:hypothetical protein